MKKVIIKTDDLKQMLNSVKNGVSKEGFRPVLNGIYIEINGTTLTMVSCDGYKLFTSSCEIVEGEEFTAIVPVFKIPKCVCKQTIIEIDNDFVTFDFEEEKHTYKLIKGDFIDWKPLFNKENTFKISFNVKYLQDTLKGENGVIDLEFSDNKSPMFVNGKKLVLPVRPKEE